MEKRYGLCYLIESSSDITTVRYKALEILKEVKEREKKKNFIPVWVDAQTLKLVDMEKIKRLKMQIIKVRLSWGRIVWMEKDNAIKKGFIKE